MTTPLEKTLKRELSIDGRAFVIAISPEELKITLKGKRNGLELRWGDLVNGEAALATALNASVGRFAAGQAPEAPSAKGVAAVKPPARSAKSAAPPARPAVARARSAAPSVRGKPRGRR